MEICSKGNKLKWSKEGTIASCPHVITYKHIGVLTRNGEEVFDFASMSDTPEQVKVKDRSNIYLKFNRIVKIKIEEINE